MKTITNSIFCLNIQKIFPISFNSLKQGGHRSFLYLIITLFMSLTVSAQYITDRTDWAGIWINTAYKSSIDLQGLQNEIAGEAGRLKWTTLNPPKEILTLLIIRKESNNEKEYFTFFNSVSMFCYTI